MIYEIPFLCRDFLTPTVGAKKTGHGKMREVQGMMEERC